MSGVYEAILAAGAGGNPGVVPLELAIPSFRPTTDIEVIKANIGSACARGLPTLELGMLGFGGTGIMCGGGWSLVPGLHDVRRLSKQHNHYTFVLKGAWQALVKAGIRVDYGVMIDSHPSQAKYVQDSPKDMTWVIASQCAPEVFEALSGYKVLLFHIPLKDIEPGIFPPGSMGATGGPAVGSRALRVAHYMGCGKGLHLFGYDCCIWHDRPTHNYELAKGAQGPIVIECAGRTFKATPVMAGECHDIGLYHISGHGPPMTVYGDSMLSHVFNGIRHFAENNPDPLLRHVLQAPARVLLHEAA